MNKNTIKYILLLWLLIACSSTVIEGHFTFTDNVWKRFKNPQINIQINKPGIFYDLFIEIEYEKDLSPEFIPLTVITSTPDGEVRSRNLKFEFSEGDGVVREILRKDFAFAEEGICSFEIENRSQHVETPGIKKIRIILERVE